MAVLRDKVVVVAARSIELSIIVPVYNEGKNLERLFKNLVDVLRDEAFADDAEVIFVDGGSTDGSVPRVNEFIASGKIKASILLSELGRAKQQNTGAAGAHGDLFLFLHADTQLPSNAIKRLCKLNDFDSFWGRFDVRLDCSKPIYRVVEWFINRRSRLTGISTGDQAIFVSRDLFEQIKGFPDQALMEDIEICKLLKQKSTPTALSEIVTTSARKWQKHGVFRTIFLMWQLRAAYFFGASPESLHKRYYQDQ